MARRIAEQAFTVRLPKTLHRRLVRCARKDDLSASHIVRRAVTTWLDAREGMDTTQAHEAPPATNGDSRFASEVEFGMDGVGRL